jgi:hypothetical protein
MKRVQYTTDFRVIWPSIRKRQTRLAVLNLIGGQVNTVLNPEHRKQSFVAARHSIFLRACAMLFCRTSVAPERTSAASRILKTIEKTVTY